MAHDSIPSAACAGRPVGPGVCRSSASSSAVPPVGSSMAGAACTSSSSSPAGITAGRELRHLRNLRDPGQVATGMAYVSLLAGALYLSLVP